MAEDVKRLLLQIDASVELLKRNLQQGDAHLARFERDTQRRLNTIDRSFAGMGRGVDALTTRINSMRGSLASLGIVFGVGALVHFTRRSLEMASSLGEVAQQLGVTARDLQVYRYIASQVGVEQEAMDRSLQKLTRSIGEAAHGTGQAAPIFDRLKIAVRDANGHVRAAGDILPELADKISRIPDAASRAAALTRIFGRQGQQLEPLLAQGSRGIEEFTRRAEELGLVLSDGDIAKADETADKIDELSRALQVNFASVVAQNADAILGLAQALGTAAINVVRFLQSNPRAAFALLGAFIGGSRFGLPGAAVGAGAGYIVGDNMANDADDANMDVGFRARQLQNAVDEYRARERAENSGSLISFRQRSHNRSGATMDAALQEVRRQRGLLTRAQGQAANGGAPGEAPAFRPDPSIDLGDLGSGNSGRGRTANSARRERERQERRDHQVENEASRLRLEALRAQLDGTEGLTERAAIQGQIVAEERGQWRADIAYRVQQEELTQPQADRLTLLKGQVEVLEDTASALDNSKRQHELERRIAEEQTEAQQETLRAQIDLATTAKERRRLELEMVAITYRARREALQRIIDDSQDPEERARAEREMADLPGRQRREEERARRGTRPPLEEWRAGVPRTAAELDEALERVAANGLNALNEGIVDAIMGTRSLGDVFKSVANAIIADLLRIAVQRAIIEPLANFLFGPGSGGSGGGGGGLFASLAQVLNFGGPRAIGGNVSPNHVYMVGERGPEPFVPNVPGRIIPNDKLRGSSDGARDRIDIVIHGTEDFDARIARTTVATVGEMTPRIAAHEAGKALTDLLRKRLP